MGEDEIDLLALPLNLENLGDPSLLEPAHIFQLRQWRRRKLGQSICYFVLCNPRGDCCS